LAYETNLRRGKRHENAVIREEIMIMKSHSPAKKGEGAGKELRERRDEGE